MPKTIIIDSGFFTHKGIFAYAGVLRKEVSKVLEQQFNVKWENSSIEDKLKAKDIVFAKIRSGHIRIMPSNYNYLNMICGTLKKIGISKEDRIIIALDGRSSWRKAFLNAYKGNRQENRDKQILINWDAEYKKVNNTETQLSMATGWHVIGLNYCFNFADLVLTPEGRELCISGYEYSKEFSIESDDFQAVATKYFEEDEVVLVTIDEDLDQLLYRENVKIFNPNLKGKNKSHQGYYKIIPDPLKVLDKKIRCGDVSDNIKVDKKNDTEVDIERRKLIIDLLHLPSFIEDPIVEMFDRLRKKSFRFDLMPFPTSLGNKERFEKIYEQKNIVTMEKSIQAHLYREEKLKASRKKSYEKQKAKKALQKSMR